MGLHSVFESIAVSVRQGNRGSHAARSGQASHTAGGTMPVCPHSRGCGWCSSTASSGPGHADAAPLARGYLVLGRTCSCVRHSAAWFWLAQQHCTGSVLRYSCGLCLQLMLSRRCSWNTRAAPAPMPECVVPAPATHTVHADPFLSLQCRTLHLHPHLFGVHVTVLAAPSPVVTYWHSALVIAVTSAQHEVAVLECNVILLLEKRSSNCLRNSWYGFDYSCDVPQFPCGPQ